MEKDEKANFNNLDVARSTWTTTYNPNDQFGTVVAMYMASFMSDPKPSVQPTTSSTVWTLFPSPLEIEIKQLREEIREIGQTQENMEKLLKKLIKKLSKKGEE